MARKKSDTVQLSKIRMREALRASLAEEAKTQRTTLNAIIVDRLERSRTANARMVDFRDYLAAEWGRDIFDLAISMSKAVVLAERTQKKRWTEDEKTFELFTKMVMHIATNYRDSVVRNYRDTSKLRNELMQGSGRLTLDELAERLALLCGRNPPDPPQDKDAATAAADRENNLSKWKKHIAKSRPLQTEEDES